MNESALGRNTGKKICLLLTATVDVRGVPDLQRSDPIERLSDYRWALEQWKQCHTIDGLIFVENSGYDVDELQEILRDSDLYPHSVEFLSFNGQDFPRKLGKGYGENLNVEYVLRNSEILRKDDYLIFRSNGRNYVENIDSLVDALYPSTDILCDLKEYLTWGDGKVLAGTVEFFENYVCPYGREVDDSTGYYFEHALARAIHRGIADGLVWRPNPEPPLIRGFSGTSNQTYSEGRLFRRARKLKHKVKLRMLRQ